MQPGQSIRRPSPTVRALLITVALALPLGLAGCSMTPVHGGSGSAETVLALTYAEPQSRREQVFYREISARLSGTAMLDAPHLSANLRISARRLGLSEVRSPVVDRQITASVSYSVTHNGQVIASGNRNASASYQTTDQIVGDDQARQNAEDSAIRAVADLVRLALIAELTPQ